MYARITLITAIAGLVGCAGRQVVAPLTMPPRSQAMGESQRIRLMNFTGPRGDAARRRVSSLIVRGKLHRLVDGANQSARAVELEKQVAGGAVAVKGGTGATVMIAGETAADGYESEVTTTIFRKCTRRNRKKKCTKYVKVPNYRLLESCTARVTGKITRVADGQVLVQRDFIATRRKNTHRDKRRPPSNQSALCSQAARGAVDEFAGFITPMKAQVALDFHEVSDIGDRTEKAINLVKRSRLKAARPMFEAAVVDPALDNESRAWARYNLAVVMWAQADFEKCIEQLDLADAVISDEKLTKMRTACREYIQ